MPQVAEVGGARQLLQRQGRIFAARLRMGASCPLVVVGILAAPPSGRFAMIAVGALVLGWSIAVVRQLTRANSDLRLGVDVAILGVAVLTAPWTTPPVDLARVGTGWAVVLVALTMVSWQFSVAWPKAVLAMTAMVGLLLVVILVTPGLLSGSSVAEIIIVTSESIFARWLFVMLGQAADRADAAMARDVAARELAAVEAARREAGREYAATLHDTAAGTLLMVGLGVGGSDASWLGAQARRDLATLSGPEDAPQRSTVRLPALLTDVLVEFPHLDVTLAAVPEVRLDPDRAQAVEGAVREALANVARHSGATTVRVGGGMDVHVATLDIVDAGRGFVPESVPAGRRGIGESLKARMHSIGGEASVCSAPGQGTRVRLAWPAMTTNFAPAHYGAAGESDSDVAATLSRGLRLAVVTITVGMLVGLCLPRMVAYLGTYGSPAGQVCVFLFCLAVVAYGAVLALMNRSWGRWRWVTVIALLISTVVSWRSLAQHPDPGDWHFGMVGWLGLIVLFDRPFLTIAGFIGSHVTVAAVLNVAIYHVDRTALLGLANVTVGIVGLQLAAAGAAVMLRGLAATAVAAARREEEAAIRDHLATQLHADRLARYRDLDRAVRPLLAGLASGALDPSDALVRRRCALEAARLRRLFAEADDVPDPLLHELAAAADVAQRRGVLVTLATTGSPVAVPRAVRRELTEPLLHAVTGARSWARVAVTRHDDAVSVSVTSDADGEIVQEVTKAQRGAQERADVVVTSIREGGTWWVKSQWTRP